MVVVVVVVVVTQADRLAASYLTEFLFTLC